MNRGSMDLKLPIQNVSPGFNEAPIHESGKCDPAPAAKAEPKRLQ